MSRSSTLILIGVIVLLAPFIGVPESWIAFIEAVCGIVLVGLGIRMRSAMMSRPPAIPPTPTSPPEDPPHPSAI